MDIIKHKNKYFSASGILVILSIVAVLAWGLNPGIDLKGGTQWQVSFESQSVTESSVTEFMKGVAEGDVSVTRTGEGDFIIRLSEVGEENHQRYLLSLTQEFGEIEEKSFSSIGPTVGTELRKKAVWGIIIVLIAISLYIAWAFRKVSRPIQSWKYGLTTLVTLFHDVSIPTGMLALFGTYAGIELDTNFIVALLVVMGFSVHDTIVVFDRIRENLLVLRGKNTSLAGIINQSIRETLMRSINTSVTLIVVLLALIFFGPSPLFYFILTILVGTVLGTYSSIFIASPMLYLWAKEEK